jgi:hypothetical protein
MAFDAPLWPVKSLPSAGACYRALRRLPGQVLHLLEERVFQDAPCISVSTIDAISEDRVRGFDLPGVHQAEETSHDDRPLERD